eukprot:TRINITY_DN4619_c0_g1_i1.p1 TRINITY_DN4619_c0_g1~~TRINITY_DN4619_c0_g1_i1.p1  ORF type:complete len:1030 (-),score=283.32 TRINITY_DN4619_c0_g1_i1:290-3379(-)
MPPPLLVENGVPAEGTRGWHDRRWADGEVPEKIKKITGWKRAMKTFMNQDPKLNDLVQLFTQKFVQLGQSRNFTLSTLMDLAWTVLILTWEAVLSEKLPRMDEVERGFKEKYEDLQKNMAEMRSTCLEEVTHYRDRFREETLSPEMMAALNEINDGEDHGVYRLEPEIALDPQTKEYFKAAMIENLKIAMTRGASAAGDTIKSLMAQLAEALKEIESLKNQLEDLMLQLKLAEGREQTQKPVRRESRQHDNADAEHIRKLQAEIEELKKEMERLTADNLRMREILKLLGIDPDASLDDIRRMLKNKQPEEDTSKDDAERAAAAIRKRQEELERQNAELLKKIALLEKELEELRKKQVPTGDKAAKELSDRIKELEKEVERLKKALADAQNAKPAAGNDEALRKRCEELEKEIARLKKQLNAKGDAGMKDLLKRNEELEAEIQKLNSKIELLNKELAASKRDAGNARQELAEAKAKISELEEELDKLRHQVQELQEQLSNQKPRVKKEAPPTNRPAPKDRSGEIEELQAELDEAREEIKKLKDKLKKAREENERLEKENRELKDALEEAIAMRKALEAAMEELRLKFEELKKLLQERGIDVSLLDEALAAAGLSLNPMSVFDRLYMDALRRFKRLEEKFYVDIQQAQRENWERLLGIHRGRALNRSQLEELSAQGLIDIRNFPVAAEEPERGRELPPSRSPSPSRAASPTSQFLRSRPTPNEGLDRHMPSLSLNVVAQVTESGRPYSVVSEEGSYAKHHQLQYGQELDRSRSPSPEASRQNLSQTLPAQRSGRPSRSPSPANRSQLARSRTDPLMLSGQGQTPSVFEFPGPSRAPRSPPAPPPRPSPSRYSDGRDINADDGRWLRGSPQLIIEPLLLPLQPQRRPVSDTDTPSGKMIANADSIISKLSSPVSDPHIPKLSSPVADPLKLGYVQMLLPDPAFSPIAVKASSKTLPQIVTPSSHAGKLEKLPGSAGNHLGLSRSQSLSGMGEKPSLSQHRLAKAPLQKVTNQGAKQDIMITGVAQTRSAAQT